MDEQLIRQLEELVKSNKANDQAQVNQLRNLVKELVRARNSGGIKDAEDKLRKFTKQVIDGEDNQKKFNESLDELTDSQKELIKTKDSYRNVLFSTLRATGRSKQSAERLADAFGSAGGLVQGLGQAAYAGSGRLDDFTSAFQGKLFGLGDAVAFLGGRVQANLDTFRTLSDVGATFGQSIVGLRQAAFDAGLPLMDFAELVRGNSENLAALFGSSSQGAKAFGALARQFRQTQIEFLAPLGLTVSELNDTLLTSLTLQRRTGNFVEGATGQQILSARNLAQELDKLSKLTGQQRSTLTANIEAQLSNEKFLAFLGTVTDETGRRLSAFSASVSGFSPQLAEGFQDLIANAGTPVTEASRMLVMNIPEASAIVKELTAGTISSSQAMVQLRDAAQRSNQSLRGVAQTGQVEFARLFGEVNKLATAKLDERAVTDEQRKRQDQLVKQFTQFENASKDLSSAFQSIETGFFQQLGGIIGEGGSGINQGLKMISAGISNLDTGTKSLIFMGQVLSKFFLNTAQQILITAAGVRLGMRGIPGMGGSMLPGMGTVGRVAGRAGVAGLGAATAIGGAGLAGSAETPGGKALGIGTAALGGAVTGAQIGMLFGPAGAAIGGLLGGIAGAGYGAYAASKNSRNTGTFGETGMRYEPQTAKLTVHKGETVLNPQDARAYYQDQDSAIDKMARLNTTLENLIGTNQLMLNEHKAMNNSISTLVGVQMKTERNTDKANKTLAKVGPSLV